jgi:hypothetical protein
MAPGNCRHPHADRWARDDGKHRSDQIGSVSTQMPPICNRNVEWPMKVTAIRSRTARAGGGILGFRKRSGQGSILRDCCFTDLTEAHAMASMRVDEPAAIEVIGHWRQPHGRRCLSIPTASQPIPRWVAMAFGETHTVAVFAALCRFRPLACSSVARLPNHILGAAPDMQSRTKAPEHFICASLFNWT